MKGVAGRFLYAFLFCGFLPLLLAMWASAIRVSIPMPPLGATGPVMIFAGIALIIWGIVDLRRFGKGLPMNAFPPAHYVARSSYGIVRHPIYTGFCILCAGLGLAIGSSGFLYLITPVMILCCWALVIGFEQPDLERRFGKRDHRPFFSLPPDSDEPPSFGQKLAAGMLAFGLWAILYGGLVFFGVGDNFRDTTLFFEGSWPVIPAGEIPYALIYIFTGLVSFVPKTQTQLRTFALNTLWAVAIGSFIIFILPFYTAPRPITTTGWLSDMLQLERNIDSPGAAFPSFHVILALLSAMAWTAAFPKLRWLWIFCAAAICWSCSATGVHSISDIAAGAVLVFLVHHRSGLWHWMQSASERLANSWRSYTIGNFRVINHSVYAGIAGVTGTAIASQFIGENKILVIIIVCTLAGGAIWGQLIEGSSRLLRPFGYYGAILGGMVGVIVCDLVFHYPWEKALAAFALASPWTQATGRLRCLVQGCCHGKIASDGDGIVIVNEHSRVCKISGLKGRPVHNTPLYSILSNIVIGLFLWRIWFGGASDGMIAGVYFILAGVTRFVEEQYRGEIQTPVIGKLSIYQWTAVGSVIVGAALTTIGKERLLNLHYNFSGSTLLVIILSGFVSAFAMGMDFPKSNIPFSRLSG